MIYADMGINWFFPYEVVTEEDEILVLKELPRQHRNESTLVVDRWITLVGFGNNCATYVGDKLKLVEIV